MDESFTYIVAFSVFTNTCETDMLELVDELKRKLTPGGALAFTFIDPYYMTWGAERGRNNLQWRLDLEAERRHITRSGSERRGRKSAEREVVHPYKRRRSVYRN